MVPGYRWLGKPFDADALGFNERANVRLIGPRSVDLLDDDLAGRVQSILFTERSRYGILVRVPGAASFGLPGGVEIETIADDVAILCEY